MKTRPVGAVAVAACLAAATSMLSAGCGGEEAPAFAAQISPEMQKQRDEMLKNYGKQAAERGRANRGKKSH